MDNRTICASHSARADDRAGPGGLEGASQSATRDIGELASGIVSAKLESKSTEIISTNEIIQADKTDYWPCPLSVDTSLGDMLNRRTLV